MSFEERHSEINTDPAVELRRRLQSWATAPDSRGVALDACIVPRTTVIAAADEIERLRKSNDDLCRAVDALEIKHGERT